MTSIEISVLDFGMQSHEDDYVKIYSPVFRPTLDNGAVVSTAPQIVRLVNGKATIPNAQPGILAIEFYCRNIVNSRPVVVTVPNLPSVRLVDLMQSTYTWDAGVISAIDKLITDLSTALKLDGAKTLEQVNKIVAPLDKRITANAVNVASADVRIDALESMSGMGPGTPADGQTAVFVSQADSVTRAALDLLYGGSATRQYTAPQEFGSGQINGAAAFTVGQHLRIHEGDGNAGQRFVLTGTNPDVMPYFEVVANTRIGTDGGAAVAGVQVHLGPDVGAGINRQFLYIEAVGEKHSDGPHFRIGSHASGTQKRLMWKIENGTAALIFNPDKLRIEQCQPIVSMLQQNPYTAESSNGNLTAVSGTAYGTGTAQIFLGKAGGTSGAGTAPAAGQPLGQLMFGSKNGASTVIGGMIRQLTNEAWAFGTAQGTRTEINITRRGAVASTPALTIDDPDVNQIGLSVLVNRSGSVTFSRVLVGPADSAGTGYRTLRIAN
ncbi:hypothetical protein CKALI_11240 [Corynebacterium kalinowskii]|uniref:Uncharacterized protein n=1 Tax=Corynebacterium kalinowskii TaxID=2675216 RepID=A0A6B8VD18_9CORY|nr:hypothetical protein [Corynebacterium kalinowskii]QGU03092.1 hypothetical protein CKALI_11240 [Corynebacterium kalinowskii]